MDESFAWITDNPVAAFVALLFTHLIVSFIRTGYEVRCRFHDLPGPPHHWLWGHIPVLFKLLKEVPTRVAPLYYADLLREKYDLGDVFYFDLWPIGMQFLMVVDPNITNQLLVKQPTPKNALLKLFMRFLVGSPDNLLSGDGHKWVQLRKIFNPGFASSSLNALIPDIVEECDVFCGVLEGFAQSQDVFRLEEKATLLTIDVIGRAILDTRLKSQVAPNDLATAITNQVAWIPQSRPDRPWEICNPMFLIMMWWNNRKMDSYISGILDRRFTEGQRSEKSKNVIDLAFESYSRASTAGTIATSARIDADFKRDAICQIKTLMFAGHDTVSGTLCYTYYLLSKHPKALDRIRAEHTFYFGDDPCSVAQVIETRPTILQKLDYTLAVLKETLRLFPPASTVREGNKDLFIKDPKTGRLLPTEKFAVSPVTVGMHRHPKHFPNPHSFVPERFLSDGVASSASSNPAYLPFSRGPRTCIGQELALLEMKIILVMTLRRFDIRPTFEDLHILKNDGSHWPSEGKGIQTIYGDEAYQVMMGSAKPREGMPVRVTLR